MLITGKNATKEYPTLPSNRLGNDERAGHYKREPNLRIRRYVIIDHHIHRRNIESSAGHISAYENVTLSCLELV